MREKDVAQLVAAGLTNAQINILLFVSEHTAQTHVRRILRKLGVRSRAAVAGDRRRDDQPRDCRLPGDR
jgi:DNA-binding CsgD family transcriptional regulator